ncbi:MAG: hypothetical protein M0R46_09475 [Candidatus Muirbacterium halophilum]|nr:hypothetical protein [Candidatus Muirbacterium halophilum]MCK9476138.1 hypothetical protein [Candidatus Muirbacterium halophilum]
MKNIKFSKPFSIFVIFIVVGIVQCSLLWIIASCYNNVILSEDPKTFRIMFMHMGIIQLTSNMFVFMFIFLIQQFFWSEIQEIRKDIKELKKG